MGIIRAKRWHFVVLVIVTALWLSGVGVARYLVPYELEDEIRIARAQSVATSLAECIKPVPPDQDAARDYDRAQKLGEKFWTDAMNYRFESLRAPGAPTRAEIADVRAAFDKNEAYLAAVHAAASKPGCTFPTVGNEEMFKRMNGLSDVATTLRFEALLQMWEGKPVESAGTLRLAANVGKHAFSHPSLFGAMSADEIEAIVSAGYRRLLLHAGANPAVDRMVRESLGPRLAPGDISHSLSGDVAWMCTDTSRAKDDSRPDQFFERVGSRVQTAAYVHWITKEIVASRAPVERRRQSIQSVIDEFDRASRLSFVQMPLAEELKYGLSMMDTLDSQAAMRRTLFSAACVLEYKARTGAYPVKLSETVSPIPADPFSRAPLSYKRTTTGFEVVSAEAARRWAATASAKRRRAMVFVYPEP